MVSAAAYATRKQCSLEETMENSIFVSQIYGNEPTSISRKSFETGEVQKPSTSGNSESSSVTNQDASKGYQYNSESSCLEFQRLKSGTKQDDMMIKLQELERTLLADDDFDVGDEMLDKCSTIELDRNCLDNHVLAHASPDPTTSSDSIQSSTNSNGASDTPHNDSKVLLFDCARLISDGNILEASCLINELRNKVSIQGDPSQRIAAYMVEGLAARIAASGKSLYEALKCKEPPSLDRLAAMQILFEVCPFYRFGFMAANGAILEACRGETRVHIIDFDISQGSQYISLIQMLANHPNKPRSLKLTGVDDPESVQRALGGLNLIGLRLEKLAEALKVPFEFQAVASKVSQVTPSMVNCKQGEAVIVNFAFQLHHMPDESVSIINERDKLLRMVKNMNPKLVTVTEQDINTNTAPFLQRFSQVYQYYSIVFDSLDATLSRESQDRMNVEKQCLAREIVNIIACEAEERIERYEVAGKWRARMAMAGFSVCAENPNVIEMVRNLIKQYSERYMLKVDKGVLHFGWLDKSLIFSSAWK